ncbi:AbrB/MazE/SpoVT family DNA-binding domain-containing protein [Candidatus Woesearchaeota archaeon]|nr:AbrB/MazE/SpoVT family DNA-binding domain-containing protein [Candidatus Woesearchaeota archaeon]
MALVKVKIRKWGSSLGVIIPKEIVEKKNLECGDEIDVELVKPCDLRKVFGTHKFKRSAQEIKDEMKKGWEK